MMTALGDKFWLRTRFIWKPPRYFNIRFITEIKNKRLTEFSREQALQKVSWINGQTTFCQAYCTGFTRGN